MAKGKICGIDFYEGFEAMRYWSFPSSYNKEKRYSELNTMLYSGNYTAAEKKDGYFERIIKDEDGNIFMCSRNKGVGGVVEKHEWIPHLQSFFDSLPNGTCLLGEVYLPTKTSKGIVSILGCLKEKAIARQEKDIDKLRLYVFDILAWDNELWMNKPMQERATFINNQQYEHPYLDWATYWFTPDEIHENWLRILTEGGEGVVMTRKDYPYEFKKRTARKTLKLKKELEETIDVFLTGKYKKASYRYTGKDIYNWQYWFNELTNERVFGALVERASNDNLEPVTRAWYNGWAGSVEIGLMKDGKVFPIGWISGIDDSIKQGIVEKNQEYIGKVAELQAMEIDRSGEIPTLRHGRIIRWRDDKSPNDCEWSQLL